MVLENNQEDSDIINTIFRTAHSLKGMAATMGFESLTDLTHKVEKIFDRVKNDELKIKIELNKKEIKKKYQMYPDLYRF